ncbi:MAG: isoleucine--tRNA ligase [Acidobacteriota bacterium]
MPAFRPVPTDYSFQDAEVRTLALWKERRIFEKSLERPAPRGPFLFYEGPPTANGLPHAGHVLTRVVKDLFPRYRTMCGYRVDRKGGWDTHGLPVEIEVEKELGISGKDQIEAYGVEPFIRKCMASVFRYTREWEWLTERIGFWLDQENAYVTYHASYVESVWWSLHRLFEQGLLFQGHKVVPWCPRCGTALSSHEVGQGYESVQDPSVFVGFRTRSDPKTLLLAWTTTPWTLVSNAGLAVKADVDYAYVRVGDLTYVLAAALVAAVMGKTEHELLRTVPGRELVGTSYEPLYAFAKLDGKKAHVVIAADFVGLDAGSGIVHVAPAFGADDYKAGLENGLPVIQLVDTKGQFTADVTPWAGRFCKEADKEIARDLKERGLLFKQETYQHDYPHCWRCHGPLIYFARDSWFIRTTQELPRILANNQAIAWLPETIKDGRFGKFLEANVDWALSRERYWGTPLPIWRCTACAALRAFPSRAAIRAANPAAFDAFQRLLAEDADLSPHLEVHKPYIDAVAVPCERCGAEARRVPEVIDCWYDSGSMPFAQWGYPHAAGSEERFRNAFPADFISEAVDQTRGWFYSLLAVSTLVFPEKPLPHPYRLCIVLGHVGDEKGKKLSKHHKNYVPVVELVPRGGADALRWFFLGSGNPWTNCRLTEANVEESKRDFLLRLHNVYSFFVIYASIDRWDPANDAHRAGDAPLQLLDRWILSELSLTTSRVRSALDAYDIYGAATALSAFVDGLSNWYVRRSRDRFWRTAPPTDPDKRAVHDTLFTCLITLSKLLAPFVPFYAEELHQNLVAGPISGAAESVHLESYPEADASRVDEALSRRMAALREIVSLGHAARSDAKIRVRQPLAEAVVVLAAPALEAELADLLPIAKDELHVERLTFAKQARDYVDVKLKLNFPALGPKLGPRVKKLQAALAARDGSALGAELEASGNVTIDVGDGGPPVTLSPDDLKVEVHPRTGFAARTAKTALVALDTTLTDDLRSKGLAREVISLLNGWRGERKLAYEARIRVRLGLPERLRAAVERHRATIAAETLAVEIAVAPATDPAPEGAFRADVDGEPCWGSIDPVA